eukprot:1496851-Pyramimonas_sp.AAC.2
MDNSRLGHFFSVDNYLGGELNSPVVEGLTKGLMTVWSPTGALARHHEPASGADMHGDGYRQSLLR